MAVGQKRRQLFLRLEVLDELLHANAARGAVANGQRPPRVPGDDRGILMPQIETDEAGQHLRSARDVDIHVAHRAHTSQPAAARHWQPRVFRPDDERRELVAENVEEKPRDGQSRGNTNIPTRCFSVGGPAADQ